MQNAFSMRKNGKRAAAFALLPETKPPWRAFGAGATLEFTGLLLLVWIPLLLPQKLVPQTRYSVIPLVMSKPVSEWKPQPPPKFRVKPIEAPKTFVARKESPPLVAPRWRRQEVVEPEAPAVAPQFKPVKLTSSLPPRPRPDIRTGVLSAGSSAPATVNLPASEVQTGGFGDPFGVPAVGDSRRPANIAARGSSDLPPGPGYGNGSGGARGVRGTVVSAGFGNGIAVQPGGGSGRGGGQQAVRQGVFADAGRPAETARSRPQEQAPSVQPVEIFEKPNPVYTAEARALRIEGEVLLQVVFAASDDVRVLRVVRGLGHGLDEAAVAAARHIRFKPQRVNGKPVDSTAVLHVVFQLAY